MRIDKMKVWAACLSVLVAGSPPAWSQEPPPPPLAWNMYSSDAGTGLVIPYLKYSLEPTNPDGPFANALNTKKDNGTFANHAASLNIQVFGNSIPVTIDTGSTGIAISKNLLPAGALDALTSLGPGAINYTSSNITPTGTFYELPVSILGGKVNDTAATHYLRCVFFKSGWYGKYFTLISQVAPLFMADRFLALHGHSRDGAPQREYRFHESWTEDPEAAARKLSDLVEQQALPQIADVDTPAALANNPWLMDPDDKILNACAGGDFDEAERLVVEYVGRYGGRLGLPTDYSAKNWRKPDEYEPFSIAGAAEVHKFHEDSCWRMAYLGKLLQTDRSRVPALLHEWEEFTVNAFKLNKYWTRTPFPCEA